MQGTSSIHMPDSGKHFVIVRAISDCKAYCSLVGMKAVLLAKRWLHNVENGINKLPDTCAVGVNKNCDTIIKNKYCECSRITVIYTSPYCMQCCIATH